MNLLDLALLIIGFMYFFSWKTKSSLVHTTGAAFALLGYFFALLLASYVSNNFVDDATYKAISTVAIVVVLPALCYALGAKLGQKLRQKALTSNYIRLDGKFFYPSKAISFAAWIFVITQTFLYLPVTPLQFMAQGSTLFITTGKFMQDGVYAEAARSIDPDQFSSLQLQHDKTPVSTVKLEKSQVFGDMEFAKSESIVRVTGTKFAGLSSGIGSGFSVGDGFFATAAHVVADLGSVYVRPVGGGAYPATPLVIDHSKDVAILYSTYLSLPPLALYDGRLIDKIPAMALGFPGARNLTASEGEIYQPTKAPLSSDDSPLSEKNTYLYVDPEIEPGSSGSAVIDKRGDVIGIAIAIKQLRERRSAIGYKIVDNGDVIVIDSNIVREARDKAKRAFRSQGTGLGRTFTGY